MDKKKHNEVERMSFLLARRFFNAADDKENDEIEAWADGGERRRQISNLLQDPQFVADQYRRQHSVDVESALYDMKRRIGTGRFTLRKPLLRVAAAVAIVLLTATALFYRKYTAVEPPVIAEEVRTAIIQSNESGRAVAEVESVGTKEVKKIVRSLNRQADDDTDNVVAQLLDAKRITTRSDKEFWVTLPDGTLVHLNYDSRLIYPEQFIGDTRDVIVEGEAYFMVAKDRRHPFIVHTPHGTVKEYGTEFNVDTRSDNTTNVVLVEGSISVTPTQGAERMMKPGEMCMLTDGQCSMEAIDTAPYVAWNTGRFSFDDCELRQIMQVLGKWYGYEVEFEDADAPAMKFSGNFNRYDDIGNTIESIILLTDLDIVTNGNKIIIRQ